MKYVVYSYQTLTDQERLARTSPRQRKVGSFTSRAAADRAAWDAVERDAEIDAGQVLRGGMQVYWVDREAIRDGALPPPRA